MTGWQGTPGPWRLDGMSLIIAHDVDQTRVVAKVDCKPPRDQAWANAAAIAAVPAMIHDDANMAPGIRNYSSRTVEIIDAALKQAGVEL